MQIAKQFSGFGIRAKNSGTLLAQITILSTFGRIIQVFFVRSGFYPKCELQWEAFRMIKKNFSGCLKRQTEKLRPADLSDPA